MFEPSTEAVPLLGLVKILRGLIKAPFVLSFAKAVIVIAVFFKVETASSFAIGNKRTMKHLSK